jgi:hypothetical protein
VVGRLLLVLRRIRLLGLLRELLELRLILRLLLVLLRI